MIVLDTNVISEPLRVQPEPAVIAWLNAQRPENLYTTALTLAELYGGTATMPAGKRKANLDASLRKLLARLFKGRVLNFDTAAAEAYAEIAALSRKADYKVPYDDALIAAIAQANNYTVATRNTKHFVSAGVPYVNPWTFNSALR